MQEVFLGKIKRVTFGFLPDTPAFGLELDFSLDGGSLGVSTGGYISFNAAKHNEYCKWTVDDQRAATAHCMFTIIDYMNDAKVTDINKLVNIPIEIILNNNCFSSFRILTEVL